MYMHSRVAGALVVAAAVLLGQGVHETRWWESADFKSLLRLSDDQSRRLEQIYDGTLIDRVKSAEELDRLSGELDALIDAPAATEQSVEALADRVMAAQAQRNRLRTLMLYRMHQVLTPSQREQLKEFVDEGRKCPNCAAPTPRGVVQAEGPQAAAG
jgi:Spy/CpxP family protein refolding chaperone